jgi:hypothetical protein
VAGDADAFRSLTLLLAVCEQALLEMEDADKPFTEGLTDAITRTRDEIYAVLTSPRFPRRAERS